ncbi:MAG: 3-hydroxyacyl-CoA dehydrogenase NAD-binding domain-containing protein [Saprospiraceae bacterium]|nr:3-hydroxyacyl-CoA dehydrogenase NAD-binding domain-containing protein [Saprospiraceae bacterium]
MIHYKKDTDNIATLTFDMKDRPINVINHEIGEALGPVIEHLKNEKARGVLKGVIITSAKKTFLSGGDLEYIYHARDEQEISEFAGRLKKVLRDLESPGVPVVAAINGSALGSGFEVALACHHRIVIDNPETRLGNPEIQIGLIPGSGAIIRLMWLLGIQECYPILTSGRRYAPQEALKVGIIDELAKDQKDLIERAKTWLLENREYRRPWDQEGEQIPGGTAHQPATAQMLKDMATNLASKTHNNYPASQAILNILFEGSKVDFDTASQIETRYYTRLVMSKECKNMIKAFWFDYYSIKRGHFRPKGFGRFRPKKVGIIGAGTMGSRIAFACLKRGMEVVLKDVSKLIAERGRHYVIQKVDALIAEGRMERHEKDGFLKRIQTTEDPKHFQDCDLVIEAVFENAKVKQKVTKEAEGFLDEYTLFASNTISIPITELAEVSMRPDHYVGLHFFHPADEVPLVEIVKGSKTSDETIARAYDFAWAIKKIPIVVKDDWGFYAARVQNTFILEGITMLQEGYSPALIENLSKQAGMPKGALAFADDLGLDMVLKYENQAAAHYGNKYIQHPAVGVLSTMLEELKRPGRKKKKGFYEYDENGDRKLWQELQEHFPTTKTTFNREELIERFLFAQVLEACWCMQEGVISSVPEANLGSIHGWGFPAFKGGVIQFVHNYELSAFTKRCKQYEKSHGQRFKVPKALKKIIISEEPRQTTKSMANKA